MKERVCFVVLLILLVTPKQSVLANEGELVCSGLEGFERFPAAVAGFWKLDERALPNPENRLTELLLSAQSRIIQVVPTNDYSDPSGGVQFLLQLVSELGFPSPTSYAVLGDIGGARDNLQLCTITQATQVQFFIRWDAPRDPTRFFQVRFPQRKEGDDLLTYYDQMQVVLLLEKELEIADSEKLWLDFDRTDFSPCASAISKK